MVKGFVMKLVLWGSLVLLGLLVVWDLRGKERALAVAQQQLARLERERREQEEQLYLLREELREREVIAGKHMVTLRDLERERAAALATLNRMMQETTDECARKPMPSDIRGRLRDR